MAETVHKIVPNTLEVRLEYPRAESAPFEAAGSNPIELFSHFYKQRWAAEPPQEITKLFGTLYEEALLTDATD
jgi:hypothetical protein